MTYSHAWRLQAFEFVGWLVLAVTALAPAPALAQPFAYVANDVSHNVSVIDAATNTTVATIDVGAANNPASVAVSPNGQFVYVANSPVIADQGSVSVVATATNTVVATIATGGGPYGVAVTPNGAALYVTNFYGSPTNNVWAIDTSTNTVSQSIPVGSYPHGLAITPDGAFVYVANTFSDSVSVIATATNTVTATVPVGSMPHGIAISPNGSLAYVSNYGSGSVSAIATASNIVTATIQLSTDAIEGIAFSGDGAFAYVCHQHADFLSIIHTATHTVVGTITVGVNPFGLALAPNGQYLYVANQGSGDVSVVDTQTNAVDAAIPTAPGSFPANLAFTPALQFSICALYDTTKAAKSGSTIPIKLQLCDASGVNFSSPEITLVATSITQVSSQISGPVEDSGQANPDHNFRYDPTLGTSGGYIFNLSTKGLITGTYVLAFTVSGDAASHSTAFQVK